MRLLVPFLALTAALGDVVVVDRIAVIAAQHVIKLSDIDRDLRLTEFLNGEPLNLTVEKRRQSAERLIDLQIIRGEVATGGYTRATNGEAEALLRQIRHDRFGAADAKMRAELARYALIEDDLRAQLLWQLTVLKFIQQRFQPEVTVSDQDVRAYYNQHLADLQRRNPKNSSFEALAKQIRTSLEGEGLNKDFEDWLASARQRTHIEYRQEAFQ
jgi:hypothetical protein